MAKETHMRSATGGIKQKYERHVNMTYLIRLGMIALLMVSASASNIQGEETVSFRIVPIPKGEHGYSNFESTVIASPSELDAFLQNGSKGQNRAWNNRTDFEKALAQAKLDFARESLVLLRHTEGSGSVQVNFRQPEIKDKRIICQIDRKEPEMGTADMAYYCFALVAAKTDVTEVELKVSGRKPIIISVGKEQVPNQTDSGSGK